MAAQVARCSYCKRKKRRSLFSKSSSRSTGLQAHCKSCDRRYYKASRSRQLDAFYRRRYNTSLQKVEEVKVIQNNSCAICKQQTQLVVDHCHQTRQFRALLCGRCNLGLGKFKDDPSLLRAAAVYLESFHA